LYQNQGVTSISITIFNKAVLTSYNFNYANTLALGQAVFSIFFLVVMKRMKYVDYPEFSFHVAAKVLNPQKKKDSIPVVLISI
jgi:solute carrier family 35 protein